MRESIDQSFQNLQESKQWEQSKANWGQNFPEFVKKS